MIRTTRELTFNKGKSVQNLLRMSLHIFLLVKNIYNTGLACKKQTDHISWNDLFVVYLDNLAMVLSWQQQSLRINLEQTDTKFWMGRIQIYPNLQKRQNSTLYRCILIDCVLHYFCFQTNITQLILMPRRWIFSSRQHERLKHIHITSKSHFRPLQSESV